jgi:hypothetical protein
MASSTGNVIGIVGTAASSGAGEGTGGASGEVFAVIFGALALVFGADGDSQPNIATEEKVISAKAKLSFIFAIVIFIVLLTTRNVLL